MFFARRFVGPAAGTALAVASFAANAYNEQKHEANQQKQQQQQQLVEPVKLVSYNLLSPALSSAKYFTYCQKDDCDAATRLSRVKAKLEEQMEAGAVICLQEVCRDWAGQLLPFLEERGYSHSFALSGGDYSGYMGVGLAWPRALYIVDEVSTVRLSDTVSFPKPNPFTGRSRLVAAPAAAATSAAASPLASADAAKPFVPGNSKEEGILRQLEAFKSGKGNDGAATMAVGEPGALSPYERSRVHTMADSLGLGHESRGDTPGTRQLLVSIEGTCPRRTAGGGVAVNPALSVSDLCKKLSGVKVVSRKPVWAVVKDRHNCCVSVKLRERGAGTGHDGASFAVTCYHMPCLFKDDLDCQVMVAHATLLMQYAQRFAGGLPYIVAGDFNVKPYDACYKVITEGSIPDDHPQSLSNAGSAPWDPAWRPVVSPPLRSAYKDALGSEPDFTNFARTKGQEETFCECLDYIFLSPEWIVRDVVALPASPPSGVKSFPTAQEPSDHILIGAELLLA